MLFFWHAKSESGEAASICRFAHLSSMTDDGDTFKILVATDNHLGYLETDRIRGDDSFRAFEEILQLADRHQVDFILLGGDLFHDNRPSRHTLYRVMTLIRQYCFGSKPCQFTIASDQSVNFVNPFKHANVFDPNLNVSYPIFSIHGNHDDPIGFGDLCALDQLAVAGLVNYFGRSYDVDNIEMHPILLQKGQTRLALYGLGNIRDERLHRAWVDGQVSFVRPRDEGDGALWLRDAFNLFVLHQNRARRGPKSYIPEEFLDDFLDLVIWGHEHDCRIDPEHCSGIDITQPGSSVATSLADGEAIPKHVGLLTITGRDYRLEKIRLASVRPFEFTTIALSCVPELTNPSDTKACERYLESVVEDLIQRAQESWQEQQDQLSISNSLSSQQQEMPLPLIRIRVDYSQGFETFNTRLFARKFRNRVANPLDILKFYRSRTTSIITRTQRSETSSHALASVSVPERLETVKIEDLLDELLGKKLELLPENQLAEVTKQFVEKDDRDAMPKFVEGSLRHLKRSLDNIQERGHIQDLSEDYVKRRAISAKEIQYATYDRQRTGSTARNSPVQEDDNSSHSSED